MKQAIVRWLPALLVAAGLLWLMRRVAAPDTSAAVLGALHAATPATVERITVYPLLPDRLGQTPRPFELRGAGQVRALLPGLRRLRPLTVDTSTFRPLFETTLVVHLSASLVDAWHLRGRDLVLRLATTDTTDVALRAQSPDVLGAALLARRVRQLRDSLGR